MRTRKQTRSGQGSRRTTNTRGGESSRRTTTSRRATTSRRTTTSRRAATSGHRPRAATRAGSRSRLARTLVDHDEIRRWAEERRGQPAAVKGTARRGGDIGMIRIDFPGYTGEGKLVPIDWEEWLEKFEESNLALIVQDRTAGGEISNFNKLVAREGSPRRRPGARTQARAQRPRARTQARGRRARAER